MTQKPIIAVIAIARSGTHLLRDIIAGTGAYVNASEFLLPLKEAVGDLQPYNYWRVMGELGLPVTGRLPAAETLDNLAAYCKVAQERTGGAGLLVDIKHGFLGALGEKDGVPVTLRGLAAAGARFIHLRRRNLLEQVASNERALTTSEWVRNDWLLRQKPPEDVRIELDTDSLLQKLAWYQKCQQQTEAMLKPFAPIEVHYEDMLEDGRPSPSLRVILADSLGITVSDGYVPKVMKISPALDELVANMADVQRLLAGSAFAKFLPQPASARPPSPASAPVGTDLPRIVPLCKPGNGILAHVPPLGIDLTRAADGSRGYLLSPRKTSAAGLHALVFNEGVARGPVSIAIETKDGRSVPFDSANPEVLWRRSFGGLFFVDDGDFRLRIETSAELTEAAVSLHHLTPHRPDPVSSVAGRAADAIVIGSQDPATAALARLLGSRNGVWINPLRDVGFLTLPAARQDRFCRMLAADHPLSRTGRGVGLLVDFAFTAVADAAWYRRMFRLAPARRLLLDVAPRYSAFDEDSVRALKAAAPKARILFLMRNPVERALAAAWQRCARGTGRPSPEQFEAECFVPANLERSDYCSILTRWEAVFGRRNMKVIFSEDVGSSPATVVAEVASFLGLPRAPDEEAGGMPPEEGAASGFDDPVYAAVRARLAAHFLPQLEWLCLHFGGHAESWLQAARRIEPSQTSENQRSSTSLSS